MASIGHAEFKYLQGASNQQFLGKHTGNKYMAIVATLGNEVAENKWKWHLKSKLENRKCFVFLEPL